MKKYLLLLSVVVLGLSACKKSDLTAEQVAVDDAKIQAYMAANNVTATKDPSGIYYNILKPGAGTFPTTTSTVKVSYIGKFLNGSTFETSSSSQFVLSGTVAGFQTALLKIKGPSSAGGTDGGRIMVIIPSSLAYGTAGSDKIPANSVIIFTIDLNGIGN